MIISCDTDDENFEGFQDFDPNQPLSGSLSNNESSKNPFALPNPKTKFSAPVPPEPVKVIQPSVGTEVQNSYSKTDKIIEVDSKIYQTMNQKLASDNMIIRDKTVFNGVGRQRHKSQLTYLSQIDIASRGEAEAMSKHITRARVNSRQMYGW